MPPTKQPKSLSQICSRRAADIAIDACLTIERDHGEYGTSSCQEAITTIRNYFLENVGPSFESVCEDFNSSEPRFRFPDDPHIWLDFIFHENKQIINLPSIILHPRFFLLNISPAFWAEQLSAMKRITNLDISCTPCNDEVIKAISDNCRHLELLRIKAGVCEVNRLSDDGLLLLNKCPELRIILETSQFKWCQISTNPIRSLVISLSRLIAINWLIPHLRNWINGIHLSKPAPIGKCN